MADTSNAAWIDLARWPVAVLSVLLALIAGKHLLGIGFGNIAEISAEGVKFEKAAGKEIAELSSKLNGALEAIEQLKSAQPSRVENAASRAAVVEASQTVSDQAAKLADVSGADKRNAIVRGYIWIGDFNGNDWQRIKLGWGDTGRPVDKPPAALQPGTEFRLLANMVVRDGQPPNDANYFNARRNLGVAPTGSRVRLVRAPVLVDREFAKQYWAEVDVL